MKLSSKLHDRTAMCKDVSGGHWSSCLRGGNKSWLSLVSFNRVLFCILVLWRKKCWFSIWLSLKKVAAVSGSCCPLHPLGSMLQALPGFSSSRVSQQQGYLEMSGGERQNDAKPHSGAF